jgi:hypothetical protein
MPEAPGYVYGQGPDLGSTRRICLGLIEVQSQGQGQRRARYRPVWSRLLLVLPLALAFGWVLLAEGYYFNQRYMNGITTTRRADMYLYLPDSLANWATGWFKSPEEIRLRDRARILAHTENYGRIAHLQRKGEFFVAIAKAAYDRQDYAEFSKYIGTGASLAPANLEAQQLCAGLFFAFSRPDDAYQVLEESLPFALQSREHFRFYLRECFKLDQDSRIIATATKYLAGPELTPEVRADLQIALAQTQLTRGNFADCAASIERFGLDKTPEGFLLRCQLLWESGDHKAAMELITSATRAFPTVNRLLGIKAGWLKDEGRLDAARDCVDLIQNNLIAERPLNRPALASARIQALNMMPGAAKEAERRQLVEAIVAEFGSLDQPMMELARYGAAMADPTLTERLRQLAAERRFSNQLNFVLVHAECLINARRPREAITLVDALYRQPDRVHWTPETTLAFDAIRTLAYFADDQPDIGAINLSRLMQNRNIPPQLLLNAARKLIAAQRYDEANTVLIQTHILNEQNQAILMQIVRLKLEHERISADLELYLRRLMATRRPPKELLEAAARRLGSDTFLFSGDRSKLLEDIDRLIR